MSRLKLIENRLYETMNKVKYTFLYILCNGMGIVYEGKLDSWTAIGDLDGAKLRIFPEEWYMPWRLSVGILDVSGISGRESADGYMQDGAGGSVEALENWVTTMNGYFLTEE